MQKIDKKFYYKKNDVIDFLRESNYIEQEYSDVALQYAIKAWDYAVDYGVKITPKFVMKVHGILIHEIRPDIAGKLRDCNVSVGGRNCPDWTLVSGLLNEWCKLDVKKLPYIQTDADAVTKSLHVEFEKIHPFEDGNGRVGRILYNLHRLKLELPIHIIKEEERFDYYEWFKT